MSYDDRLNSAFQEAETEAETLAQGRYDYQCELVDGGMSDCRAEITAGSMSNNAIRVWLIERDEL